MSFLVALFRLPTQCPFSTDCSGLALGFVCTPDCSFCLYPEPCVCASCSVMSDSLQPHGLQPARLLCPWNSPGKNIGVDSHSLLQGIFQTQRLNLSLPQCRQILHHLNHQGNPSRTIIYDLIKQLLSRCAFLKKIIIFLQNKPTHISPHSPIPFRIVKAMLFLLWVEQMSQQTLMLQEGGPLAGPETGLLSNTRK